MLSTIVTILIVMLAFKLAQLAFDRKDKVYGLLFSIIGVSLLAIAINDGLWNDLILLLIRTKDLLIFLIVGMVSIRMIWIWLIVFVSFWLGAILMAWAINSERRGKKSGQVDGVRLVRKMNERERGK